MSKRSADDDVKEDEDEKGGTTHNGKARALMPYEPPESEMVDPRRTLSDTENQVVLGLYAYIKSTINAESIVLENELIEAMLPMEKEAEKRLKVFVGLLAYAVALIEKEHKQLPKILVRA
jgi:hypothetical protein